MLQRFHRLNEFYTSLLYSVALMLEWVKDGEKKNDCSALAGVKLTDRRLIPGDARWGSSIV